MSRDRAFVEELLTLADVRLDGERPWDIAVHDDRLFHRVVSAGSLGLGEAYMDGWWDCERLDVLFDRLLSARLDRKVHPLRFAWHAARSRLFNRQRRSRAFEIGERHYDIGNDLYERMLDRRMIYSCGYWREADDLDAAQEAKLDLICRKLQLAPGQRVLDIGCGWGGAAAWAAEKYGVSVVGITVSREQVALATERWGHLPVEFRLQDWRDVEGPFDRIFSIGMFEHVGYKNYRRFFEKVRSLLAPDGLFVLHTIGGNRSVTRTDPWIERYIFPNSMLPSARQITTGYEDLFVLEDWHSFGHDYDRTLMCWHERFENAWPEIAERYGERFHRMWRYYLLSCAGSFRSRRNQLWQLVLSPDGVRGGYVAPR